MLWLGFALTAAASADLKMLDEDMRLPHVAVPRGVPPGVSWREKPRVGMGDKPGTWKAFTLWGQIYAPAGTEPPSDVRAQVRNAQAWILSKRTGMWKRVQGPSLVTGAAYREDFAEDANKPIDVSTVEGLPSVQLSTGYNYHFWDAKGRTTIEPEDVGGVVVAMQGRIVGEVAKNRNRLMLSAGADYWSTLDAQWDQWKTNGDVGIGRFRWLTGRWQWYTMTSLSRADLDKNPPPSFTVAK